MAGEDSTVCAATLPLFTVLLLPGLVPHPQHPLLSLAEGDVWGEGLHPFWRVTQFS